MTPFLIRLLLIILAIWLVRWFLKSLTGSRQQSGARPKDSRPEGNMVKDPICGMYMDSRLAVKHETKNGIFYFCSEECKSKFLKIPPGKSPEDAARTP